MYYLVLFFSLPTNFFCRLFLYIPLNHIIFPVEEQKKKQGVLSLANLSLQCTLEIKTPSRTCDLQPFNLRRALNLSV